MSMSKQPADSVCGLTLRSAASGVHSLRADRQLQRIVLQRAWARRSGPLARPDRPGLPVPLLPTQRTSKELIKRPIVLADADRLSVWQDGEGAHGCGAVG